MKDTLQSDDLWLAQAEEISKPRSDDAAPRFLGNKELERISSLNAEFETKYRDLFHADPMLSRPLVSFQANKSRAVYRWFRFKEAFSVGLIEQLLDRYHPTSGLLLDPFAGSGTALFAAGAFGMSAEGIELLPIGQRIIATKQLIDSHMHRDDARRLTEWGHTRPWKNAHTPRPVNELRITRGAYPAETLDAIGCYLAAVEGENDLVREVLLFALLCVLESISYTRKDGQYLRWDHRSGRGLGKKKFDKGQILPFEKAIGGKLREIVADLQPNGVSHDLFSQKPSKAQIVLHRGSCLEILPNLPSDSYDCIITSPPYCNRYDYTRTYALELALLGVDEAGLVKLRQDMLSCTVENRAKDLLASNPRWQTAILAADNQPLLQAILVYLDAQRQLDSLNNNGIPRMVRGYFYEMSCVVADCFRVLKPGARLLMVNDNVRYAGASVSVDIILSELASTLGFDVEEILVLPSGKGNSSQQMGAHGRDALRKCVYVWRKN